MRKLVCERGRECVAGDGDVREGESVWQRMGEG